MASQTEAGPTLSEFYLPVVSTVQSDCLHVASVLGHDVTQQMLDSGHTLNSFAVWNCFAACSSIATGQKKSDDNFRVYCKNQRGSSKMVTFLKNRSRGNPLFFWGSFYPVKYMFLDSSDN